MRPKLRLTVILALVLGAGASIVQARKRLHWMRPFNLPKPVGSGPNLMRCRGHA
jgi:hypothetical protein